MVKKILTGLLKSGSVLRKIVLLGVLFLCFFWAKGARAVPEGVPCNIVQDPPILCDALLYCDVTPPAVDGICVCRWGYLEAGWISSWLAPADTSNPIGKVSACEFVDYMSASSGGGPSSSVAAIVQLIVVLMSVIVIGAALISIVIGGYIYMTAGGSADRVRQAKTWIGAALLGIVLVMVGWTILNSINQGFTTF